MFTQRTAIGLDVHARSIRATALGTRTGEALEAKLPGVNEAATVRSTSTLSMVKKSGLIHPGLLSFPSGPPTSCSG